MDYSSAVDYLFNQLPVFQVIGPGAYKPGLDTAHKLAQAFSNPHEAFRCVHVGGTNGKGSTSHSIASVLQSAGMKVGLFTSPHIFDFRERIRVNGEKIPENYVTEFLERYLSMDLGLYPSFFELTTIMAFDYFRFAKVDIAVIEVGLGGRLDTTNIIKPEVSVITNVSLDHTALLGSTEPQIAFEKAGIIKEGVPAVIGEATGEVRKVFADRASEVGAPIVFAEDSPVRLQCRDGAYTFERGNYSVTCDLIGEFQAKNINTVLHAIDVLGDIPDYAVAEGMANVVNNTGLMGRWTVLRSSSPKIVCDTGHNIGAWRYLAPMLDKISKTRKLRMVMGFVNDKDISSIFDILPKDAVYYFVTPSVKRGRQANELVALASLRGLDCRCYDTVVEGYEAAVTDSGEMDMVFVGGSNFVVADLPSIS